jgi:hypothetical protein
VIKGLVINRFSSTGINISASLGTGNKVEGNFIGTDPTGTTAQAFGQFNGVASTLGVDNTIGGASNEARNVISGNTNNGVFLSGSSPSKVEGNYIGTQKDGTSALGNGYGVLLNSNNNTVGDPNASLSNVIAFNARDGVIANLFTGNRILSNSIHSNGDLGINLPGETEDAKGVTANDKKDPDTGANNLQNYPDLASATTSGGQTTITGKLNSRPRTNFTIQFFSSPQEDPSGFGEGKTFLGQQTVKTSRKGNGSFSFIVPLPMGENVVTATATNETTGDTSEFSKAITAS